MSRILHALAWAGGIIAAALISTAIGLGDGASFAVTIGLATTAIIALGSNSPCALRGNSR